MDDSYVQLGPVSHEVWQKATYIKTNDFETWSAPVSMSYFKRGKEIFSFLEFKAYGIFDPQVDYLYVNVMEFKFIKENLITIYGSDLVCTEAECYFNKGCHEVRNLFPDV